MKYRIVTRVVEHQSYKVESDDLREVIDKIISGDLLSTDGVLSDSEDGVRRCERVVDGKAVALTPAEQARMNELGYDDVLMHAT